MYFLLKMEIFHGYVSLPEGNFNAFGVCQPFLASTLDGKRIISVQHHHLKLDDAMVMNGSTVGGDIRGLAGLSNHHV